MKPPLLLSIFTKSFILDLIISLVYTSAFHYKLNYPR